VLRIPAALEKVGAGTLCVLSEDEQGKTYGRALTVADRLGHDRVLLAKWIRRVTNWNGRQAPLTLWEEKIAPLVKERLAQQKTPVVSFQNEAQRILALVSIADLTLRVPVDKYGVALWKPVEREVQPADCAQCPLVPVCRQLPASTGVALLWRRLGLVDAAGVPTLRGRVVSFFSQGDGLAIAAALEDSSYSLDELIYDLADLDAGFRFAGEDINRWGGGLGIVCHEKYGLQSIPGYLENGVPPKYGAGAEQIVASVHKNPLAKQAWITDLLGPGDIDRVIIEWRSLLRQIAHAPELDWPRWRALQAMAKTILNETESPTLTDLPPLEYHQTRRVDHRLILRRHRYRLTGRFQALAAPVHLPHSSLYRCTKFVTSTASSVFAMGYAFSALLVLFAVGRERTKACSILVPTSGCPRFAASFTLYGATKTVASAIAGNPQRIP
jgi:hypothetical protein